MDIIEIDETWQLRWFEPRWILYRDQAEAVEFEGDWNPTHLKAYRKYLPVKAAIDEVEVTPGKTRVEYTPTVELPAVTTQSARPTKSHRWFDDERAIAVRAVQAYQLALKLGAAPKEITILVKPAELAAAKLR
jgi:hypothetical protein